MDLDALAESARNRGLKLVRSRVRTPGKRGYGRVGVTDASGKPLFGFAGKDLTGTAEDAEKYLRSLGAADWDASVGQPNTPRRGPVNKTPANDDHDKEEKAKPRPHRQAPAKPKSAPKPQPAPKPKPAPKPAVRRAKPKDAANMLPLLTLLGYSLDERGFARRLAKMIKSDCAPMVATVGDRVVGLCGLQVSSMLQREKPVGRVTVLVVAEKERGKSIGRMLMEAAEAHFRSAGCELIEVTSNDRHLGAHAFYRRLGFERTSIRFAKTL